MQVQAAGGAFPFEQLQPGPNHGHRRLRRPWHTWHEYGLVFPSKIDSARYLVVQFSNKKPDSAPDENAQKWLAMLENAQCRNLPRVVAKEFLPGVEEWCIVLQCADTAAVSLPFFPAYGDKKIFPGGPVHSWSIQQRVVFLRDMSQAVLHLINAGCDRAFSLSLHNVVFVEHDRVQVPILIPLSFSYNNDGFQYWFPPEELDFEFSADRSNISASLSFHFAGLIHQVLSGEYQPMGRSAHAFAKLLDGRRPALPETKCQAEELSVDLMQRCWHEKLLVDLMQRCWQQVPEKRPDFQAISQVLEQMLSFTDAPKFVNMTPHEIGFYSDSKDNQRLCTLPSMGVLRVEEEVVQKPPLIGVANVLVPLISKAFKPQADKFFERCPRIQGTWYIVSQVVQDAVQRPDFLVPDSGPDGVVRDDKGKILGTKRFICLPTCN